MILAEAFSHMKNWVEFKMNKSGHKCFELNANMFTLIKQICCC